MQPDTLDRDPNDAEATGLCREHVDLLSTLPSVAEEALNGIGGLKVPVHRLASTHK